MELRITPPPAWTGTEEQWHERLAEIVAEGERVVAVKRRKAGLSVLGPELVKHQDAFGGPRNRDQLQPKRNPVIAAGGDVLMLELCIEGLRAWRAAYHERRERWTVDKKVCFPRDTWCVVQRAGAAIAA